MIEHALAAPRLGRDLREPYRGFGRLDLAKERTNIIEFVVAPVLKKPCSFRRDLPLAGVGQCTPSIYRATNFVDD
jgi:hypothetical protein